MQAMPSATMAEPAYFGQALWCDRKTEQSLAVGWQRAGQFAAFEVFRSGTICERATMTIDRTPARWTCPRCDAEIPRGNALRCAACHDSRVEQNSNSG